MDEVQDWQPFHNGYRLEVGRFKLYVWPYIAFDENGYNSATKYAGCACINLRFNGEEMYTKRVVLAQQRGLDSAKEAMQKIEHDVRGMINVGFNWFLVLNKIRGL